MIQTILYLKQKLIAKRYYVFLGLFSVTLLIALVSFLKLDRKWDKLSQVKIELQQKEIDLETWRARSDQLDKEIIWFDDRTKVRKYLLGQIASCVDDNVSVEWVARPKIKEMTIAEIYAQQIREAFPSIQAVFQVHVKKGQVEALLKELSSKPFLQVDALTVEDSDWALNRCEITVTQKFAERLVTKVGIQNL